MIPPRVLKQLAERLINENEAFVFGNRFQMNCSISSL